MLHDHLQIYTLSIVFLGEFNPVIIQPYWLAHKKLIREQEAQNATVDVIHNEIVKIELDWAKFEITKNRFEVRTSQEPYFEPLKDLIISIFEILRETPIISLGINHLKYFSLPSEESYYNFGNKLAPLSTWNEVLNDPRMLFLEILEQDRKDKINGKYRVRIQPSDIKMQNGILIQVNDHIDLNPGETGRNGEMVKSLGNNWRASMNRATEIIETVWKKIQ